MRTPTRSGGAHPACARLLAASLTVLAFAGCAAPGDVDRGVPEVSPDSAGAPEPSAGQWRLVWSDEFDGNAVDRSKWAVRNDSTLGDGNLELACLLDRPENVRVADGALRITARREERPVVCGDNDRRFPAGRSFTTAFLETRGLAEFRYGRFEVRARLPAEHGTSKGLWPAFWMRPADMGVGEIDVVEGLGSSRDEEDRSRAVLHAVHYDYDGTHPMQNRVHVLDSGSFADGFHTFAVEWEPASLRWYVDDEMTYERTPETTPWFGEAFSRPFFLRLNLAVGGTFPGAPDEHTELPADYVIDWVRVSQR